MTSWLSRVYVFDLRTLALLRIAISSAVLWDLMSHVGDWQAFYTDFGLLPRAHLLEMQHRTFMNFHLTAGTLWGVALLHGLLAISSLAMLAGYHTRAATFLTWVLTLSLHHRNPLVLDIGHAELRIVLFWCLFLPLGARASLDSLRNPDWTQLPNRFFSLACLAYLVQVSLVYLWGALNKSDPSWRMGGDALYYALNLDSFTTPAGQWLRQQPELMRHLTGVTWVIELLVPLFLLFPWRNSISRPLGWLLILLLHIGVSLFLNLGPLGCLMVVCSLGILPWPTKLVPRLPTRLSNFEWPGPAKLPLPARSDRPSNYSPGRATRWLVSLGILYILYINIAVYRLSPVPFPVQVFGYTCQLYQNWSMFAPHPGRDDGWFVVEARQSGGKWIDLGRNGQTLSYHKPDLLSSRFPSQRWRCWMLNLHYKDSSILQQKFLAWSVDRWNAHHQSLERVDYARLVYIHEDTPPPGKPFGLQARIRAEYWPAPGR